MIGNPNQDFRGSLETAIAYRLVEMNGKMSADAAEVRVRDVAKYGLNSVYHAEVIKAALDLYGPIIAQAVPFLRAIVQSIIQTTEAQNTRGRSVESKLMGDDR